MAMFKYTVLLPNDLVRNNCSVSQLVVLSVDLLRQPYANQRANACCALSKSTLASQIVEGPACSNSSYHSADDDDGL